MIHNPWLLPEGIEECLPDEAKRLEALRLILITAYKTFGYQIVIPPYIEYLDSLLAGMGHDMDKQTFKLTDTISGRLIGIRADMTPQVARIDAHRIQQNIPTRFCYIGHVLHSKPQNFSQNRNPIQIGAELYGHSGIESDSEILHLALKTMELSGLSEVILDIGHVGIYRALAKQAKLDQIQEAELLTLLQGKEIPELTIFLSELQLDKNMQAMFLALADLNGNENILEQAKIVLKQADVVVLDYIHYLEQITQILKNDFPNLQIHYDLAELHGYHYKTGLVFALYLPGRGEEIIRGGRYDGIGSIFGRTRAATGFSADLQQLERLSQYDFTPKESIIWAPWQQDTALSNKINTLREQGHCVIQQLPKQEGDARQHGCDKILRLLDGKWIIEDII